MMRLSTAMNTQVHIRQLCKRAQIPYEHYYAALYAAFNCWYRNATQSQQDTEALTRLFANQATPFEARLPQSTFTQLRPYMYRLYALTNHQPLSISRWGGSFKSTDDYEGLVWFWYAVRCMVVHGEITAHSGLFEHYVKQAFETLQICMAALMVEDSTKYPEIAAVTPLRNT